MWRSLCEKMATRLMLSREDCKSGAKRVILSKKRRDEMAKLKLRCPVCETTNQIPADELNLECGKVSGTCVCENCGNEFSGEQPYWRFLSLNEPPSVEGENQR